jgi:hypothetical protein
MIAAALDAGDASVVSRERRFLDGDPARRALVWDLRRHVIEAELRRGRQQPDAPDTTDDDEEQPPETPPSRICPRCGGTGRRGGVKCSRCNGTGRVPQTPGDDEDTYTERRGFYGFSED